MTDEFKQEDRYIVFKVSDMSAYLSSSEADEVRYLNRVVNAGRTREGKENLNGVFVEEHWPEFEPTWDAIQARVTGTQPAQRMNMQTADQITQAFKAELQALLDKYGAELSARDTWQGYPECGEDVRMLVDVPAIYDSDHNCLREYTEIDLGSWVMPTQTMPKEAKP